jgi:dihydrofolate reductase
MTGTPKVVVSTTLDQPSWGHTTLISGNVVAELSRLRQQPGGNIQVAASGSLVRLLLQEGLLDELRLLMHPIVVGTGQHLFEGGASRCRSICSNAVRTATVIALRYALAA